VSLTLYDMQWFKLDGSWVKNLFHDKVAIQPIDKHIFIRQEVWIQIHHVYFDSIIKLIDLIELS
jgi:hypothetical protein